jgi:hypothetical protein
MFAPGNDKRDSYAYGNVVGCHPNARPAGLSADRREHGGRHHAHDAEP